MYSPFRTKINERDKFRFSSKMKTRKRKSNFRGCLFNLMFFVELNNMAGQTSTSPISRNESQRESFSLEQGESLASNVEFMQLLRRLPNELTRLEREIKKLKRETNVSSSRVDPSSKRYEKWWESRWQTREKQLKSKQEDRILQLRTHYEEQLKNNTEILQKNNSQLQDLLKESTEIATQISNENEKLKQKLQKSEQQLQEQLSSTSRRSSDTDRFTYKQQMLKAKQALEEKRKELNNFKERHAAFSEQRVRSDQRRAENTLSRNRQSQLESEYVTEFKDGSRVDAIDKMTKRFRRLQRTSFTSFDYLKCCRLACFIFETAYEVVANVKESFTSFTSTVLQTLAVNAAAIGSDNKTLQRELFRQQNEDRQKETIPTTQDALSEVLILVKEEAKDHDLNLPVQDVKRAIARRWKRQAGHLLLEYDSLIMHELNDYINYCTRFAWCALTQVPPMKIDYSTDVYSSRSHMVSQAFTSFGERSPNRTRRSVFPEAQKILCYLWPVLQDFDGKVIRKGEVVLDS